MNRLLNDFLPDASAPDDLTVVAGIEFPAPFNLLTKRDVSSLLRPREAFSHKGTYGHALIIAGAAETMGAALLAAKGCLYAGAGLTTAAIPPEGLVALNTTVPEVMYISKLLLKRPEAFERYNAIAIGPGLMPGAGLSTENLDIIETLHCLKRALIVDADMLTFLANGRSFLNAIGKSSILTPHMKEFDRLFGAHASWWERIQTAIIQAKKRKIIIVLKNQFTLIVNRDGRVFINSTGNPAMAQGGMGDVLTGILAAFVAQGYEARDAALMACYVHGLAGDELAKTHAYVSASALASQVPQIIKSLLE